MIKTGKKLPKEVIDSWPEIFGEIKFNTLPLRYLHAVLINFKDNSTWEIKITEKVKKEGWESLQNVLSETIKSYEHRIDNIDFKLDIDRVIKDIKKNTHKFLKNKTI